MFPIYIYLGSWKIHPHLFFEALAYTITLRLILIQSKKNDTIEPPQRALVIVGGLTGALIGAKLLVIFQYSYLWWQNYQQLLPLLLQGKTIVGAILGALIGVELTKKVIGLKRSTGDLFVYPLIWGTAIGRIGCFLTGLSDNTSGTPTNLPWGVDFGDGISRHPTQLYEILFLLAFMLFLKWRSRYPQAEGDLFKFYMIGYLGFRFFVDFIKPDFHPFLGLSAIQIACLLGLVYYRKTIPLLFQFYPPS